MNIWEKIDKIYIVAVMQGEGNQGWKIIQGKGRKEEEDVKG